jgi:hypothetical protein
MVMLLRGFSLLLLLTSAPVAYLAVTHDADFDRDVASMRSVAEGRVVEPGRAFVDTQIQKMPPFGIR